MTILWYTGFDTGLRNAAVNELTISIGANAALTANQTVLRGLGSFYSLQASTGASAVMSYGEKDWGSDKSTLHTTFRLRWAAVPAAITAALSILDSAGNYLFSVRSDASGYFQIYNYANTTAYTSTTNQIIAGRMYRLEVKWVNGTGTSGSFEVRINGVADAALTVSNINTKGSSGDCRKVRVGVTEAQANAGQRNIEDLIISDDQGSLNNSWLGDVLVWRFQPVSTDYNDTHWILAGGATEEWDAVSVVDYTTTITSTYLYNDSATAEVRVGIDAYPIPEGFSVLALCPALSFYRVAGTPALSFYLRSGSTDGVANNVSDTSASWKAIYGSVLETDPQDSNAWALTDLATLKVRLVKTNADVCRIQGLSILAVLERTSVAGVSADVLEGDMTGRAAEGTGLEVWHSAVDAAVAAPSLGRNRHGHFT